MSDSLLRPIPADAQDDRLAPQPAPRPRIFLGLPSYDGWYHFTQQQQAWEAAGRSALVTVAQVFHSCRSALCTNFNTAWAAALNAREKQGLTHFCLLHADLCPHHPAPGHPSGAVTWLDLMWAEMERLAVKALCAPAMIKDSSGETSCALDVDDQPRGIIRLTPRQILPSRTSREMPNLLVNTGCLLVDFRDKWVEGFAFNFRDEIVRDAEGRYLPRQHPEDWEMSRFLRALGIPFGTTMEVVTTHVGQSSWNTRDALDRAMPHNA